MTRNNLKTLLNRRTIRKYSNKPIDEETLNLLFEAGVRASNCGNMQAYSIVVTKDEERKKELSKFHFGQEMVVEAPIVLTICADLNRFHKWCLQRGTSIEYDNFLWLNISTIDASILTQSICNAAEELGLGICYLGTVNYMAKQIADFLNLPKYVVPVASITLGYPAEEPPLTERLPLETFIHNETYKDYSKEDIDKYYNEFEELPQSKAYCEESNQENLAKVFTQSRYKGKDNRTFSRAYLDFITQQGFMRNSSEEDR
jgi:nitroreductase